jgi:hypothetical protein
VTLPSPGLIAWSFPASVLADAETAVFRFTLDVTLAGGVKQRLIDSALPVRGRSGRRDDYHSY